MRQDRVYENFCDNICYNIWMDENTNGREHPNYSLWCDADNNLLSLINVEMWDKLYDIIAAKRERKKYVDKKEANKKAKANKAP